MKLPHGRRAYEGAWPVWRPTSAWLRRLDSRRQHHQEIAIVLSNLDATGRRLTGEYAKAVEQLGSNKAPVRFDGLYALERLAQDHPAHRQTIVNVICTYLRMPFSPAAPASEPEPEATGGQREPGTESETRTDGTGTWQQERQVRLTAQRILTEHLRYDKAEDQPSADPASSRFWTNIRLNLTGATLIDFNLVNGVIADANFHRAAFSGDADFHRAAFSGDARFGGAAFGGDASFSGAAFSSDARFGGVAFGGDALFGEATFSGDASFPEAAFTGDALFDGAAFGRSAGFRKANFSGDAEFRKANFAADAWFDKATFAGIASFGEATFTGDAGFRKAAFTGSAWFDKATFSRGALFDGTAFSGDAWFGEATFGRGASFDRAAFTSDAWFAEAAFCGDAGFGEAAFSGEAWFDKATFRRGASFDEATFTGDAGFGEAALSGSAWFGDATFRGGPDALHFERAQILSPGASHVWPPGWRLADADGGGYTVVRANDDGGS
jgi:Pentapeptide repeats (9 copies)